MNGERIRGFVGMMLAPPQVVGVLLKKPGQQSDPRVPPIDPQETKIRGELYVEDLNERRIVSIRMGWLWVEGTQMKLPLRALNLRQSTPGICQPHVLALGFALSNSQGHPLATFWADTEPIYWSWVRAIAAELVRQTPFRAQRCLNFLEILTICPRGPLPLPDSPTDTRRRSRSELRCWLSNSPMNEKSVRGASILEDCRRRARSELRGWSSSNSSDEDLRLTEFRCMEATILPKVETSLNGRAWGCSESSEGSDDSLPWGGGCRSSVDSVDSGPSVPEADTREQRMERYKEARRRENEARSRRVLEEDALRRKARLEENNNNNNNNNNNTNNNNNNNSNERTSAKGSEPCDKGCRESRRSAKNTEEEKSPENNENNAESLKTGKTSPEAGAERDAELIKKSSEGARKTLRNREREKISSCNGNNAGAKTSRSERLEGAVEESLEASGRRASVNARNSLASAERETLLGSARNYESSPKTTATDPFVRAAETVDAITRRLPPLKVSSARGSPSVRFRESNVDQRHDARNNNGADGEKRTSDERRENGPGSKMESPPSPGVARTDSGERRSRARERRNVRERCQLSGCQPMSSESSKATFLQERKERSSASKIPIAGDNFRVSSNSGTAECPTARKEERGSASGSRELRERGAVSLPRTTMAILPILETSEASRCETDVAILLARCQRVDHYVPVREKLTLFESLSRMGGRLARSTEDLGRSLSKSSPRGKQRARSLHDLNRAARSVPVREMCRLFEGDRDCEENTVIASPSNPSFGRSSDDPSIARGNGVSSKDPLTSILKNNANNRNVPPCVRTSTRRKHYQK